MAIELTTFIKQKRILSETTLYNMFSSVNQHSIWRSAFPDLFESLVVPCFSYKWYVFLVLFHHTFITRITFISLIRL